MTTPDTDTFMCEQAKIICEDALKESCEGTTWNVGKLDEGIMTAFTMMFSEAAETTDLHKVAMSIMYSGLYLWEGGRVVRTERMVHK